MMMMKMIYDDGDEDEDDDNDSKMKNNDLDKPLKMVKIITIDPDHSINNIIQTLLCYVPSCRMYNNIGYFMNVSFNMLLSEDNS